MCRCGTFQNSARKGLRPIQPYNLFGVVRYCQIDPLILQGAKEKPPVVQIARITQRNHGNLTTANFAEFIAPPSVRGSQYIFTSISRGPRELPMHITFITRNLFLHGEKNSAKNCASPLSNRTALYHRMFHDYDICHNCDKSRDICHISDKSRDIRHNCDGCHSREQYLLVCYFWVPRQDRLPNGFMESLHCHRFFTRAIFISRISRIPF